MFRLVILIIFYIFFVTIYYLVKKIYNLKYLNKINNKILRIVVSIFLLSIVFWFFNLVNSIIILIHFFIFILLVDLVFYLINKNKSKKKMIFDYEKRFLLSLCITVIYMSIGAFLAYHVWQTNYEIYTNKDLGQDKLRIIQISDSHIGTTFDGNGFRKHIERISKIDSDLVVITGDFIDDDTSKEDMLIACEALRLLKPKYGIFFVFGNHDEMYYNTKSFTLGQFKEELLKSNVKILVDNVYEVNDYIYIIGRNDKSNDRKEISDLVKDLDKNRYMIDLNHQPNDYDNESKAGVDLVLSGHTHGGQLFPLGYIGVLFKANDAFYGLEKRGNTNFIINSGISDWAMDFKTGTKSEFGVIDIIHK